jgi:hypothetical protein
MEKRGGLDHDEAHEVVSFELAKARRFLRLFKQHPFLAIFVDDEGDKLRVYAREDFGKEDLILVLHVLETMIEEGNGQEDEEG